MQVVNIPREEAKDKTFAAVVNHRKDHYIKKNTKDIKNITSLEEKGKEYWNLHY